MKHETCLFLFSGFICFRVFMFFSVIFIASSDSPLKKTTKTTKSKKQQNPHLFDKELS